MDWLNQLETEHALYDVVEECKEFTVESYYLLIAEQKPQAFLDD